MLSSSFYTSHKIFQKELLKIFSNRVPAMWTNQFKDNNIHPIKVGKKSVIVSKHLKTGDIHALNNVCLHRACEIVDKPKKGLLLTCPYHHWGYHLDGRIKKTPKFTGDINGAIASWNVDTFKNMIVLSQEYENLTPIEKYYHGAFLDLKNYPLEDLVITHMKTYNVRANWKLLQENFMEWYHLDAIHKTLVQSSEPENHINTQKEGKYIGFETNPLTESGTPMDPGFLPPMPGLSVSETNKAIFHSFFPNVFIFVLPSHLFAVTLQPISPTRTIETAVLMFHPQVIGTDLKTGWKKENDPLNQTMNFYDRVNQEDIDICEKVQRGHDNETFYIRGYLDEVAESGIKRFHAMYKEVLYA